MMMMMVMMALFIVHKIFAHCA